MVKLQTSVETLLFFVVCLRGEPALHKPTKGFNRAGGGDALGAAADPDGHINSRVVTRGVNPRGDVAIKNEPGPRSRFSNLGN